MKTIKKYPKVCNIIPLTYKKYAQFYKTMPKYEEESK